MKSIILATIGLASFSSFAQNCDYQIEATRISSNEQIELCVEARLVRDSSKTFIESVEGSGGAGKRRPIFARELRGRALKSKYIFSREEDTERALCQLFGERNTLRDNLVYYGRKEEMISYNSKYGRWEIGPANNYYLSTTACE